MSEKEQIKTRRGLAKGAITRCINQIKTLMEKPENLESVNQNLDILQDKVDQYKEIHGKYISLCDESDIQDSDTYNSEVHQTLGEFRIEVDSWIKLQEQQTSTVTDLVQSSIENTQALRTKPVQTSITNTQIPGQRTLSVTSVQMHREQLESRLRIVSRKEELELKALELEIQRKRISSEYEKLKIEQELADVRLNESKLLNSTEIPTDIEVSPMSPSRSCLSWGLPVNEENRESANENGAANDDSENGDKQTSEIDSRSVSTDKGLNASLCELLNESRTQQQAFIEAIQLPKTELITFDGDSRHYWQFIRSFENIVDKDTISDSAKLARLVQYCTGRAKKLLQCCLVKEPSEGYQLALNLLKERFGNANDVSQSWITQITTYPRVSSVEMLQDYADDLMCCKENLDSMGYLQELDNSAMLVKIISKLPNYLQSRWLHTNHRITKSGKRKAGIKDVIEFIVASADESTDPVFGKLNNRFDSPRNDPRKRPHQKQRFHQQTYGPRNHQQQAYYSNNNANYNDKSKFTSGSANNDKFKFTTVCAYCSKDHFITRCDRFRALRVKDRLAYVQSKKLCVNCLKANHSTKDCNRQFVCDIDGCGKKHNRFLHLPHVATPPPSSNAPPAPSDTRATVDAPKATEAEANFTSASPDNNVKTTLYSDRPSKVALPIVPVRVRGLGNNNYIDTYALLDNGSTQTFCSDKLIRELSIPSRQQTLSLTTLESKNVRTVTSVVNLQLSDIEDNVKFDIKNVMSRKCLNINPNARMSQKELLKWEHLKDVDVVDLPTDEVNLLIGNDAPDILKPLDTRSGNIGELYATRTILGWTLNGPIDTTQNLFTANPSSHFIQPDLLASQVERMWELDNPTEIKPVSVNDRKVLEMWENSIVHKDGHYSMDIPFKTKPPCLPNNYALAERRLHSLQKRLNKDPTLKSRYESEMNDLLQKGFAEQVPVNEIDRRDGFVWHLPHHPVLNPRKPDKLRIVFDCSAKYNNISLNDAVHQGPDLMNSLIGVLLRFRQDQIAVMGDIEGMFNQVRVTPHHKDVLRFLWFSENDPSTPVVFRMNTHLFGGVWSPSSAHFALKQCAKDNADLYSVETTSTVDKDFYVDDCLKSVANEDCAIKLVSQLRDLLSRGGFHLTKWISNSERVLMSIPPSERTKSVNTLHFDEGSTPVERALGVLWQVHSDTFGFVTTSCDKPFTKRGLLSFVSSVFDPLGIAGPFTINAKALFQSLCRRKCDWDDTLPEDVLSQWNRWLLDLPCLNELAIPRCVKPVNYVNTHAQIHVFADASEKYYGAVAYLRMNNEDGDYQCSFLMSKVKLAPIKTTTIPRLELMAAVEAVKLNNLLKRELTIPLMESVLWSDSTIVLWYIRNEDKRFKSFVANRITTIHESTTVGQWRHVPSAENPADIISRGTSAKDLIHSKMWFNGPKFLECDISCWPKQHVITPTQPEQAEVKLEKTVYVTNANVIVKPLDKFINRYSDWYSLKKAVAWMKRFVCYIMKRPLSKDGLSVDEIIEAEKSIVKYVQHETMQPSKIKSLQNLSPIYNNDGLLCIGGRLKNANLPELVKHPVIIPAGHHVTELLITDTHYRTGHAGSERVLSDIRKSYWILRGRYAVRNLLSRCIVCKRVKSQPLIQRMADLPQCRLSHNEPPFSRVGIDCFGPFIVRKGRNELKRYGCLFTCLTTRAVHIEICHTLETDSFINALQRFFMRRGEAKEIRTDNGSNFVGAHAELRKALQEWNTSKIEDYLRKREIKWVFNPPTASHMGGSWERLIRSIRTILMCIMPKGHMDDETLHTVMCVVEGIINNRPITKLSNDPTDCTPLTPNHILLLRNDSTFPQAVCDNKNLYRRRWKQVQHLADQFWVRWLHEYLPTLQKRQKWFKTHRNLKVGDLVMLRAENTPRNTWPLGLVLETHEGNDSLVRSVKVKTNDGVYVRPIHKICLLEGCEFLKETN